MGNPKTSSVIEDWELRWNYLALLYCIRHKTETVSDAIVRFGVIDKTHDSKTKGTTIKPWEN